MGSMIVQFGPERKGVVDEFVSSKKRSMVWVLTTGSIQGFSGIINTGLMAVSTKEACLGRFGTASSVSGTQTNDQTQQPERIS